MESKEYPDVKFSTEILISACEKFYEIIGEKITPKIKLTMNKVEKSLTSFDELPSDHAQASKIFISIKNKKYNLIMINCSSDTYRITVDLETESDEKEILQVFDKVFVDNKIDTINLKRDDVEKTKTYYLTKFPQQTIQEAFKKLASLIEPEIKQKPPVTLQIFHKDEKWNYSSYDEFFAEYNNAKSYHIYHPLAYDFLLSIDGDKLHVSVSISAPSSEKVQSVFQIFERDLDKNIIKIDSKALRIFIGHGQSNQWKELKDHLHEKHGIDVTAYELGTRAGYSIQEVLKDMLDESSLALIVLTGEDLDDQGKYHARENVIHELGLFQGRLGFKRAIAIKEEGVTEFSNIQGLNQIRFSKGNIKETFGDVLAIIKEEYSRKD